MLQPLLLPHDCASCRLCCSFDDSDLWELPLMTAKTAEQVAQLSPQSVLEPCGSGFIPVPRAQEWDEKGLYRCPALGENGCRLPREERPFECLVWPFRVMERDGAYIICVSELCAPICRHPRERLLEKLRGGLAERMFRYAQAYPASVKPFAEGYTVLMDESGASV
ncbi:MAG: hypothetical protein IJY85_09765 [Ruminococcus sp.]|nr:hypothetical protein [Ruminococcus sp.]